MTHLGAALTLGFNNGMSFLDFSVNSLPCFSPSFPSNDGSPPVAVIDLHTHVFNARDLPLAGAIDAMGRSWVSKPVADVLKKALLALAAADDLEGPFPSWKTSAMLPE